MRGAVLESACAIGTRTRDQTVDVESLFAHEWGQGGAGQPNPLSLQLADCTLSNPGEEQVASRYFRIAFDGPSTHEMFAVEGSAKGLALQVADANGRVLRPGVSLPLSARIPEDRVFSYSMRLVSDGGPITFGDYHSTVRFKLDYF